MHFQEKTFMCNEDDMVDEEELNDKVKIIGINKIEYYKYL